MSIESSRHELPRVSGSGRAGVAPVVGVALANIVLWLLCGLPPMMKAFSTGLHRLGVRRSRIRWEQFGAR